MTPQRTDLLGLTPDMLAALANRGLVKRATKDIEAGTGPVISMDGDTLVATFPDSVVTTLPAGRGLDGASCSCGASMCRHRIGLVLAYQRSAEPAAEAFTPWSPGDIDDDALIAAFGARTVTAARRLGGAGLAATVRWPSADDPVATVALPSCTVRFLVPGRLEFVDTDAAAAVRGQMIVLAVWACREPQVEKAQVEPVGVAPGTLAAVELAGEVLTIGVANAGPELAAHVRRVRADLDAHNLRWPVAALDELGEQLAAYAERRAAHSTARVAELISELHVRHRVGGRPASAPRVLGTEEAAETPLRQIRLVSLGCRLLDAHTAQVFLADPTGDSVLVLERRWEPGADNKTGPALASRRLAGSTLGALARSNVVTASAVRSATRRVRIGTSRVAATSITPVGTAWTALVTTDYAELSERLAARPPRFVRPRLEAESVHVLEIAELRDVAYFPGAQRLDALVADRSGTTAVVSVDHRAWAPGALDAVAAALADAPRAVSGSVRRANGVLTVDPIALLTGSGVVVPDLTAPTRTRIGHGVDTRDPLTAVIDAATGVLADAAHHGLTNLPRGYGERVRAAAAELDRHALRTAGAALVAFAAEPSVPAWVAAHVRLVLTAEYR
ncbi:hypothetical protein [Pseudonocardia sp. TRM90224]|uniref:hypothetical protein n=1 Tax=Pseudonocardia sp. TRM90224 TaxID=2812678 RepID=UPI001E489E85|nr:hypothetical protein [Pseudonocardia sp. TRM90224]